MDNRASQSVEVRTNIRFGKRIKYHELAALFKKQEVYDKSKHLIYMLAFFEECYPSLIKAFIEEQHITREEILEMFNLLPKERGETFEFRKDVANGKF